MSAAMKEGTSEMKESLFFENSKVYTSDGDIAISRKQTTIEREVRSRLDSAHALSTGLIRHEDLARHEVEQYMPPVSTHIGLKSNASPLYATLVRKLTLSSYYPYHYVNLLHKRRL